MRLQAQGYLPTAPVQKTHGQRPRPDLWWAFQGALVRAWCCGPPGQASRGAGLWSGAAGGCGSFGSLSSAICGNGGAGLHPWLEPRRPFRQSTELGRKPAGGPAGQGVSRPATSRRRTRGFCCGVAGHRSGSCGLVCSMLPDEGGNAIRGDSGRV